MEYSVKHLSQEELYILLETYSDNYLNIPIQKDPNHFSSKAKGFRLNKLPKHLLHKLYYDEINKEPNSSLVGHLIDNMTERFDDIGISDLIESFKGNVLELSSQIEYMIAESNLNVSPHTILLACKYECSAEEINAIKAYRKCIVKLSEQQQKIFDEKCTLLQNQTGEQLKNQEARALEKYRNIENKLHTSQNDLSECEAKIKLANTEINSLNNSLVETKRNIDNLKLQLRNHDDLSKKVLTQRNEIISFNEQITYLNSIIQELQSKALAPDDAFEITKEIIDDLKATSLTDGELKRVFHETFDKDMSVVDAWVKLSDIDNNTIISVYTAMKENRIMGSNIEELDTIENNVCIRYAIIKSLKVLFYRFLEQAAQNSKIEQHFQSEDNDTLSF